MATFFKSMVYEPSTALSRTLARFAVVDSTNPVSVHPSRISNETKSPTLISVGVSALSIKSLIIDATCLNSIGVRLTNSSTTFSTVIIIPPLQEPLLPKERVSFHRLPN